MATEKGVIIPEELVTLLNYRIAQEELSSRLYLSMHEWLELEGYEGAAGMIKAWAEEEMEHAGWAREFLESYNFLPDVPSLVAPTMEFSGLLDIMQKSLKHEIEITQQCNALAMKCNDIGCYCAMPLALKYMDEQRDEIEKATGWIDRLMLVEGDKAGILQVDSEMGKSY